MMQRAQDIAELVVGWRRELHRHPELGFQERRTSGRVADVLQSLGYRVRTRVGRTGVVGERGLGGPIVAIRADMDALPIQEENEVSYASEVPGVMHACGHDAHTAMALGAATLLAAETFPGTVRFLFQPSEEALDEEGVSGAPRMVEDGAMEGVSGVIGLHVQASLPVGKISIEAGLAAAGVDSFNAVLIGRGGHAAYPHKVVDPVYMAAHVILAIQAIASRRLDPFDPAVVSIGSIHGGHVSNVIPEQVEFKGTLRYTHPEVQEQLHAEIDQAFEMARTLGGDYRLQFETGYPPSINDGGIVKLLREVVTDLLGAEGLASPERGLGAEDFGFFSALAPGAMFNLGCRIEGDERTEHNPRFDIDEQCLPIGTATLAVGALRFLQQES
jgi:amidohydrolase